VAPVAAASSASVTAVAPPIAAAPTTDQLPDEARMSEVERRKVQGALIRLGYYDTAVDGVFGPETRAAIRRYQHEIGGETTGRLTADQATRLVNSR
jgi:peptidoglycan hydrolase-like protein with peptidoglycan-binding domain